MSRSFSLIFLQFYFFLTFHFHSFRCHELSIFIVPTSCLLSFLAGLERFCVLADIHEVEHLNNYTKFQTVDQVSGMFKIEINIYTNLNRYICVDRLKFTKSKLSKISKSYRSEKIWKFTNFTKSTCKINIFFQIH